MSNYLPSGPTQGESFVQAIVNWFRGLSGNNVKNVVVKDNPIQAVVKSMLGSVAYARSEGSEVSITFNEDAQQALSDGQAVAAKVQAEGEKTAAQIRAEGDAMARQIEAKRSQRP